MQSRIYSCINSTRHLYLFLLLLYNIVSFSSAVKGVHMSNLIPGNQKHLTLDNRVYIEKSLDINVSFKDIAKYLCKDPSTISKEIRKHRFLKERNPFSHEHFNKCVYRTSCNRSNICHLTPTCAKKCSTCFKCNTHCEQYEPQVCRRIIHAPYVCNGCPDKVHCRLDKYLYKAVTANRDYKTILQESREGINMSESDLKRLDETITPLIRQGQSPYQILENHNEITCSARTIYSYIENNILSVKNLDLARKVKYKLRKPHQSEIKNTGIFENRTFKDFTSFIGSFPDTNVIEMDTVLGCEGSHKVLLTFYFRSCKCMLAYLLPNRTSKSVVSVFDQLEKNLSTFGFRNTFPLILTDRGGEFSDPERLETNVENVIRTSIYYCDPMASWQKAGIEKNHEYIRYVLPKGSSFDNLTQRDINLMMNHINSTARASLNGRTPFELASLLLDPATVNAFGMRLIPPDNIVLKPSLLKK